jgi:ribosomal protein S9
MSVNGIPLKDYFHRETLVMLIEQPLRLVDSMGQLDIVGYAQAGASRVNRCVAPGDFARVQTMTPDFRARLKRRVPRARCARGGT